MQLSVGGRARAAVLLLLAGLAAAVAIAAAHPAVARADASEQSILMDDYAFIYSDPAQVQQNLQQVAGLGVSTIKVSMVWSLVAPDPDSSITPTNFDAADPAAYPAGNWQRYDTLVQEADALGLQVYFQITGPAPLWATNPHTTNYLQKGWSHDIDATDFGQFVAAVGQRYSGSYPIAGDGDTRSATTSMTTTTTPASAATLPAVREWSLWNEPNEVGWLSPQSQRIGHHTVPSASITYRRMFDAGYAALLASGHAHDTILLGETASQGNTHELPFIQELFCADAQNRPLTGIAARLADCPGNARSFVRQNPGLFAASGYATHPYGFTIPPDQTFRRAPSTITMANLDEIGHTLDAIDAHDHQHGGMPIFVTEWGYKTNPPNPTLTTTLGQQETWLDEGWYMSSLMPRVHAMAQELLYDQPPVPGTLVGTAAYWANFDSGLEYSDGSPKPAYGAFRLPIWLPRPHAGVHVPLWAQIRPATVAHNPVAELQFQAAGTSTWTALAQLSTHNPDGFIDTTVDIPHAGRVRRAWGDPATQSIDYSRTVRIS